MKCTFCSIVQYITKLSAESCHQNVLICFLSMLLKFLFKDEVFHFAQVCVKCLSFNTNNVGEDHFMFDVLFLLFRIAVMSKVCMLY